MVMWPTILRSIEPQENLLRPLNIAEISYKKIAEQTEQDKTKQNTASSYRWQQASPTLVFALPSENILVEPNCPRQSSISSLIAAKQSSILLRKKNETQHRKQERTQAIMQWSMSLL